MESKVRLSEKLLLVAFSFILLFMIVHDWVPLGKLNEVQAIAIDRSTSELLVVTLVGVVQILLLMSFVLVFMGRTYPLWIKLWLVNHQIFIFAGALLDWWIPYFTGFGAEERVEPIYANVREHTFLSTRDKRHCSKYDSHDVS